MTQEVLLVVWIGLWGVRGEESRMIPRFLAQATKVAVYRDGKDLGRRRLAGVGLWTRSVCDAY